MTEAQYYIDLQAYSLQKLKSMLQSMRLIPSQRILLEGIDARFQILEASGIHNLAALQARLKTKKKLQAFAVQSGIPEDYLTVLRREASSWTPKPVILADFPQVDSQAVAKLGQRGIKTPCSSSRMC